jgi:hypothetical protein
MLASDSYPLDLSRGGSLAPTCTNSGADADVTYNAEETWARLRYSGDGNRGQGPDTRKHGKWEICKAKGSEL